MLPRTVHQTILSYCKEFWCSVIYTLQIKKYCENKRQLGFIETFFFLIGCYCLEKKSAVKNKYTAKASIEVKSSQVLLIKWTWLTNRQQVWAAFALGGLECLGVWNRWNTTVFSGEDGPADLHQDQAMCCSKKAVKPASQKWIIMLNVKDYEHVWLVWKVL